MRKLLIELGVDQGMMSFSPTTRKAGQHIPAFEEVYSATCQDVEERRFRVLREQVMSEKEGRPPDLGRIEEESGLLVMCTTNSSASIYDTICGVDEFPRASEYDCQLGKGVVVSTGYGDGVYPLVQHDGFMKLTFIGPKGEHPYDLPREERGTEAFTG